ncbi:MAG: FAD-binding oxidoreductase [Acidobacteria bacterium]|nr:FAD-binding oxidoreductase [Acidobacteriota bacterium]
MVQTIPIRVKEVREPRSVQELQDLVRAACADRRTLVPTGQGTKLHWGNAVPEFDLLVKMTAFDAVVEYHPADLTVTVQAGARFSEVQELLKENGQWIPADPPYSHQATVGGVVACNSDGPLRFGYGPVRDSVIGMRLVHGDGTVSKAGGKVVKNVAGYDLCKLYAGSFGTLGILTEISFKLRPLPEATETVLATFGSFPEVYEAVSRILRSPLLPVALVHLSPEAALSRGLQQAHTLLVRLAETAEGVAWQREALRAWLPGFDLAPGDDLWERCMERDERFPVTLRASVPVKELAALYAELEQIAESEIVSHPGTGRIYAHAPALPEVRELRGAAQRMGGSLMVERAPEGWKRNVDVWGFSNAAELELMRTLKARLDPHHILNPGRLF